MRCGPDNGVAGMLLIPSTGGGGDVGSSGCCCVVKRMAFRRIGGWTYRYPLYICPMPVHTRLLLMEVFLTLRHAVVI